MSKSKEFMLLFRIQPDFSYQPFPAEAVAEQQQWCALIGKSCPIPAMGGTVEVGEIMPMQ